jgi:hypothetical protein
VYARLRSTTSAAPSKEATHEWFSALSTRVVEAARSGDGRQAPLAGFEAAWGEVLVMARLS